MNINTAQTIAQAKAASPESLWHFLSALPDTVEMQLFQGLIAMAIIGMFGHYIKGRASGEISGSPIDYFLRDKVWRTLVAIITVGIELYTEIASDMFTTDAGIFVGWGIVLLSGLKTGYLGDSLMNKGARAEWSADERAKKTGDAP